MRKIDEMARRGHAPGMAVAGGAGWLGLLAIVALLISACGTPDAADADATFFAQQTVVSASRPSPPASPTAAPTEEPEPATPTLPPVETTVAEPEATATEPTAETEATATSGTDDLPLEVSGSGADVSDAVTLVAGVHIAQLSHSGTGGFLVTLIDDSGASVVELADGTGEWVGSRAFVVPENGEYFAEVTADGDWEIEFDVRDPSSSIVAELPFEQAGTGSQAVYFVRVPPGDHTLTATHDGVAGFSVRVISSDGAFVEDIFQTSGPVDAAEPFTVPEPPDTTEGTGDVFLMVDIRASGGWTIRIE